MESTPAAESGQSSPMRDVIADSLEPSERGWVRLPRELLDSAAWPNAELWKLFTWCLMKATFKRQWVAITTGRGETQVELLPGQFIFGRHAAAKQLKMPAESVRCRMEKLRQFGFIHLNPTTHFTIVTVCNWETYGGTSKEVHQPNTNQTPTNHHIQELEARGECKKRPSGEPRAELSYGSSRKAGRKAGNGLPDFSGCDLSTAEGIRMAHDLMVGYKLASDDYGGQHQIALAAVMAVRLAKSNPVGYFTRILQTGYGKHGPADGDYERAKAVLREINE